MNATFYMQLALATARAAAKQDEVPVGCVIVEPSSGRILAQTGNAMRALNDATAHAEIRAIREACRVLGRPRLDGCHMFTTLEPCPMCAAAVALAHIERLYYGAADPKGGGVDHGPELLRRHMQATTQVYGGMEESAAAALLTAFFKERRQGP